MGDCIFCKIVSGTAEADIVHRDEQMTAFRDRHPAAPTHILIVPNRHIESLNALAEADAPLVGHMFFVAKQLAAQAGINEGGYRLVINTGTHGGQTVFHLHLHLMGGQAMRYAIG